MANETTLPSESAPKLGADHVALTGSASMRSMAAGGLTHTSDTPLPLQTVDAPPPPRTEVDATILSNWDQPQPLQPRQPPFVPGGPAEPPFSGPSQPVGPATGGFQPGGFQSDAFQGADTIQVDPTPSGGTAPQFSGVQATGIAGEIRPFTVNGRIETPSKESAFELLIARVAVLEATLASRPAGVGHNKGPHLDENLSVDEAGIETLIDLLKEQHATAPVDVAKLTEATRIADPAINKGQSRVDQFVKGVLKGSGFVAGKEIAEQLAQAAWAHSVYSALQGVFEAFMAWIGLF